MKEPKFLMAGKQWTLLQMQTLYYLSEGDVHKEIANREETSKGTIDHRVAGMFHKAGLKNSKQLVSLAKEEGLKRDGTFKGIRLFKKGKA